MNQIAVTVKIDPEVKRQAQDLAKKLGLSLSSIVENKLREAVRERRVVFEEDLQPTAETTRLLRAIESDVAAGKNLSGPFKQFKELEEHLNNLGHAD